MGEPLIPVLDFETESTEKTSALLDNLTPFRNAFMQFNLQSSACVLGHVAHYHQPTVVSLLVNTLISSDLPGLRRVPLPRDRTPFALNA